MPTTTQACNSISCPRLFWDDTAPWSACSKPCGGGTATRNVVCRAGKSDGTPGDKEIDVKCEQMPKPATTQACNMRPCADTTYSLVSFDSRRLLSGVPRSETLAPGDRKFFTYQRPNAGAKGVCVVVRPTPPTQRTCTLAAERRASMCINGLQACTSVANEANMTATALAATVAGTPLGSLPRYPPLSEWRVRDGYGPFAVTEAACQCFAAAQACIAEVVCSSDIAATQSAIAALCAKGTICSAIRGDPSVNGGLPVCSVVPARLNFTDPAAPAAVGVFVSKANTMNPSADPMLPPVSPELSSWALPASGPTATSERRLVIWEDDGYGPDADQLLVGLVAANASVSATITMTALSAFPISFEGTLASPAGVTAQQIRDGGLTLIISLSCDVFVDPATALAENPMLATPAQRTAAGARLTPNIIALGMLGDGASQRGWNAVVRPALLSPTAPVFAAFSYGLTRITVTLPPVPDFAPTSEESVYVTLPSALLRSGRTTPVPGLAVRIAADTADCAVSAWSAWSPCSTTCAPGLTTRSRTITRVRRGLAAACPATVETKPCNTCDACSGVTCANGGICALGTCLCPSGFSGSSCTSPAAASTVYFWRAGPWARCSSNCGGGTATRDVICMAVTRGIASPARSTDCIAAGAVVPETERPCNVQACAERRLDLQLPLLLPYASLAASSSALYDGVLDALGAELASVLAIAGVRIVIHGAAPGALLPLAQTASMINGNSSASNATATAAASNPYPLFSRWTVLSWWSLTDVPASDPRLAAVADATASLPAGSLPNVTLVNISILPPSVVALLTGNASSTRTGTPGSALRRVLPGAELVGGTVDAVKAMLTAGVAAPASSAFASTGSFLPRVAWGGASFATVSGVRGDVVEGGALADAAAATAGTAGAAAGGASTGTAAAGGPTAAGAGSSSSSSSSTAASGAPTTDDSNSSLVIGLAGGLGAAAVLAVGATAAALVLAGSRARRATGSPLTSRHGHGAASGTAHASSGSHGHGSSGGQTVISMTSPMASAAGAGSHGTTGAGHASRAAPRQVPAGFQPAPVGATTAAAHGRRRKMRSADEPEGAAEHDTASPAPSPAPAPASAASGGSTGDSPQGQAQSDTDAVRMEGAPPASGPRSSFGPSGSRRKATV